MRDEMLKTLSEVAFGVFAASNLCVAQAGTPWEDLITKVGALGLCAFMVLQNYRQSENLGKVIGAKDEQIIDLTKQYMEDRRLARKVLQELSDGLQNRPCIMAPKPKIEGD